MPTLNWIGKEAVVNHHHQVPFHLLKDVPSPYEQRHDFIVPLLCMREQGNLFEFEDTFLLEH